MQRPPDKPIDISPASQPPQPGEANHTGVAEYGSRQLTDAEMTLHQGFPESTLNARFLFISLLVAVLIVGAVFFTRRYRYGGLVRDLLARAEAAAEQDPQRAQRLYRDYLNFRQDDLAARIQLSELQMRNAESPEEWGAVFRTHEAILRADVEQTDIRRKQVDVCFRLGRLQGAREHLEKLLRPDDNDGALHMLLGITYAADRKFQDAAREFDLALADDEFQSVDVFDQTWTRFQAYSILARIHQEELDNPRGADFVFRDLLRKHPASAEAFLMRASHRSRSGQIRSAAADARKAFELDPGSRDALLLAARLTLADPTSSQEDVDSLHRLIAAVVHDAADNDARPWALLAQFERRRGEMENVVTTLEQGVEQTTENDDLISLLISQLIALGRIDQARTTVKEHERSAEPGSDRHSAYLEGAILLRDGQPAGAIERFRTARTKAGSDPRLYRLASVQIGQCWLSMDQPHKALEEFNAVVRLDPGSVEAHTGRATVLAAIGRPREALRVRRQLPVENLSAALELARLELGMIMNQPPDQRDWKPVETALQAADGFDPDSSEVSLVRAMLLTARGNREEAKQVLQDASTRRPIHAGVIGAQVQMALGEGDTERAKSLLDDAATQLDSDPELDRYRLTLWKATDPRRFEEALLEFGTKEYPLTAGNRYRLLESIAVWHRHAGDRHRELDVLLKAAEARGDHVGSWFRLLRPAVDLHRRDVLDHTMQEIRRLAGNDDVRARYANALILIHDSEDNAASPKRAEARTLLEEIVKERNDWTPPYVQLGRLHLLDENRGEAAEWYRLAVVHGNRDPDTLRLTSQLLVDQMRPQDAIELFEQIRSSAKDRFPGTTTELMGQVFASQGRITESLQLIWDETLSGASGNIDHVMRGNMFWMSGATDAAEAEFRTAVEQSPADANGWLALVSFLVRRGETTAAADVVNQAEAILVEGGNLVALAQCFELVGRTTDAEAQLTRAVAAEPNNSAARYSLALFYIRNKRWEEASQVIDHLLENSEDAGETDRLAVRRLKAAGIAFTSFEGYETALELLQTNIREAVDRSTDQRVRARLLVSHTHPKFVSEGIDLFRVVERKVALNVDEQILLAQACDRLPHEQAAADDRWNALLTDYSQVPQVRESYVRRQLKRGDLEGLREHVENLFKLPDRWQGVELSTRLDLREDMTAAAVTRMDHYVASAGNSAERMKRMRQSADLLAELSSSPQLSEAAAAVAFKKSDAFYQELIEIDSGSVLAYAQLIARHDRLERALDFLEREESGIPELVRASFAILVAHDAAHDDPQLERVEEWISSLPQQQSSVLQIAHMQEAICRRRQKYDQAIELNRLVLRENPEHIMSLNNLAWLLATQKGDYRQAFELLKTAIRIAGPTSYLLDTRGLVSLEAGLLQSAIDDCRTSWEMDSRPATRYHLALAFFRSGDRANARGHLQEALAADLQPHMLEAAEVPVFEELQRQLALNPGTAKE